MQWSDKDSSRIEGKFDSFFKTVLRNFAMDWYRAKRKHHAAEVLFSELPSGQLFEPVHNDPICPLEQYLFDDLELPINITDDAPAQALRQLSRRKRQIVLLAYFCDWTDQQIGERFHVVRSTIQAARTKALKEMRNLLENNQKHNRGVIRRVPLATIVKAKNGDNTALEKILRHYQGYMLKLSQFELYDASGTVYTLFDKDLYQELQFKLVKAILDRFELR